MDEQNIFRFMETVRTHTIATMKVVTEEEADRIPSGFNNNIRWNLGHIAFVQDRVVFKHLGKELSVPKLYKLLFAPGTSPADWEFPTPTMPELLEELDQQKDRLKKQLAGRLAEELEVPFTTGLGLTFYTIGELFLFTLYHEGLHMGAIKRIQIANEQDREKTE
jgi:hypothetical protein